MLMMKNIGEIYCIRLSVKEDSALKIKTIKVDDGLNILEKDANAILKCGEFCSVVFCKDQTSLASLGAVDGMKDFMEILKNQETQT